MNAVIGSAYDTYFAALVELGAATDDLDRVKASRTPLDADQRLAVVRRQQVALDVYMTARDIYHAEISRHPRP